MKLRVPQLLLDRWFAVLVTIKGLDGIVETLTGAVLAVVPAAAIKGTIASVASDEIQEGRHAFVAHYVLMLDQRIDAHVQLFAALYLIGHGVIKIGLATALLKRYWKLYPWALVFLGAFVVYQIYLIGYNHSVLLAVLTAFDCMIMALTYGEMRRHRVAERTD